MVKLKIILTKILRIQHLQRIMQTIDKLAPNKRVGLCFTKERTYICFRESSALGGTQFHSEISAEVFYDECHFEGRSHLDDRLGIEIAASNLSSLFRFTDKVTNVKIRLKPATAPNAGPAEADLYVASEAVSLADQMNLHEARAPAKILMLTEVEEYLAHNAGVPTVSTAVAIGKSSGTLFMLPHV